MFKTENVEAILRSASVDSKDDKRIARCVLHIPLTHALAKELSDEIAEDLFRKVGEWKFEPRGVTHVGWDVKFPAQRMEFREAPAVGTPGGFFPGVEVKSLAAFRPKGQEEFILAMGIRFEIGERQVASKFLFDLNKQTVFLTFTPMQRALPLEHHKEQPIGKFINDRAHRRQAGFTGSVRPGAAM